jgi:carbonic anhydrase/acetyltransferase-like protein (isoleucine patch superfamily)
MPLYSFEGVSPTVHPEAWIAPTATLVGDVVVEKGASIWYGVVIRADLGRIVIREGANIQDNSVIHVGNGVCEVGKNATVGHQCLVHDCMVGEQALIGNGAIVLDGAVVGERTLIAAGATVTPGSVIPPESIAMGSPAKKIIPLEGTAKLFVDHNAAVYHHLAERHAATVALVEE